MFTTMWNINFEDCYVRTSGTKMPAFQGINIVILWCLFKLTTMVLHIKLSTEMEYQWLLDTKNYQKIAILKKFNQFERNFESYKGPLFGLAI